MRLVKLQLVKTEKEFWVNPAWVVGVYLEQGHTCVMTGEGEGSDWQVTGTPAEVVAQLAGGWRTIEEGPGTLRS